MGGGIVTDDQVVHSGKYSASIERNASSLAAFSTLTTTIPLDFAGKTIEWRGFIKWENVGGFVALWLREDGDTPALAFATLQGLNLNGTRDWTEYSISVSAMPEGKQLYFGFLLSGTGKAWVDDLQLLVDGIPVAQAGPAQPRVLTVLDMDHEFDQGSHIALGSLSDVQIKNLAKLAKVWGFLKYHHPAVTTCLHHWDYEFFRILPRVLDAPGSAETNAAISAWIANLGDVADCEPCASLDSSDLVLSPDIDWMGDEYADSNEAARLRDIAQSLTRGSCGEASVVVRRGDTTVSVQAGRVPASSLDLRASSTHDLPGDTFRMLTDDIAYLKLSSVNAANSASYIRSAAGTKGLIIDIRNYPSEFVVFALGQLLISQPTPFVRFTTGDVANPGAFRWGAPLSLVPQAPHYSGKVVILVDEISQSQAEYTTMAFRSAPGAIVIGSTTAGADGNVSTVPLPGGLSSLISGIGVFYPDNRPTQRLGIIPDIEVRPTIEGIRAGRDELIEEAIRQIRF